MLKRLFDIILSFAGLLISLPVLIPVMILIWLQDFHSPFYIAPRVGKNGKIFNIVKLRSMIVGADRTGVDSTSSNDSRITSIGRFIRAYKLDELSQLWNVLKGEMSLVGPRPQVQSEVEIYTEAEKELLTVRPGITDLASIVFADEGNVLEGSEDPDLKYNQVIRPWKSRLALLYISSRSIVLYFKIIFLTICTLLSRKVALRGINKILEALNADDRLKRVAKREAELYPYPPPGAKEIVSSR